MRAEAQAVRCARAGQAQAAGGIAPRPWWPRLKRAIIAALFLAVAVLLWRHAREVDWQAVAGVVRGYPAATLLLAAGLAALSHGLYACYDLIGRRHAGHRLPATQVLATAFVSYAFNLNLGALVGGVALRFRLYSRLGLSPGTIAQVLGLSIATNWLGYLVLAGTLFVAFPLALPPSWGLGSGGLRGLGALLLALAGAYLLMCLKARRRVWRVRGGEFKLPPAPMALLQLALSCANWLIIAGVVAVLLGSIDYASVLGVLLIAAVAGVIAHVPAGLGVLEAVFIALLSHRVAQAELIGALLAYRALYYLAPLALALGVYLLLEARSKQAQPPRAR